MASGLLQSNNVVFYHPLDSSTEQSQNKSWTGTLSFVNAQVSKGVAAPIGSTVSHDGGTSSWGSFTSTIQTETLNVCAMTSTMFVLAYRNVDTGVGYARVGVVAGTDITWGTPTQYITSLTGSGYGMQSHAVCALDASRFVILYYPTGSRVGTVTGTSISFGTATATATGATFRKSLVKIDTDKVVFVSMSGASNGVCQIGTASGSNISWTASADYRIHGASNYPFPWVVALTTTKFLIAWQEDNYACYCRVGVISGSDITFGQQNMFRSGVIGGISSSIRAFAISSSNVLILYRKALSSGPRTALVATISGTDITYGPEYDKGPNETSITDAVQLDANTFCGYHVVSGSTGMYATSISVSGSTVTWGTISAKFGSAALGWWGTCALSSGKTVIAYDDGNPISGRLARIGVVSYDGKLQGVSADYPTAVGKTKIAVAMWCKNPTKGSATITVERGYKVVLSASKITLGGSTAEWTSVTSLMSTLNDGNKHLLALQFSNTGGSNWTMQSSVDGGAWSATTAQSSGSQAVLTTNTNPSVELTNPGNEASQWADEIVMWVNNDPITNGELQNLYDLSQVFGDSMDQYESNFGAPLCWQATAKMPDGSVWRDAGSGPCPQTLRIPHGATDIIVTDDGQRVYPMVSEG